MDDWMDGRRKKGQKKEKRKNERKKKGRKTVGGWKEKRKEGTNERVSK